jgi:penicillin-binding protein 1C
VIRKVIILLVTSVFFGWWILGFTEKPYIFNSRNCSSIYFDKNGKLLGINLTGDEKYRIYTPLNKISNNLVNATLQYEDANYWWHYGFDPLSLFRSVFYTLLYKKDRLSGASTITMQLVRNRWRFSTKNIFGKFKQILLALWIERHFSKKEILEAYLNSVSYGANIEGIEAAARIYFNKSSTNLTKDEAYSLAVIPQNPIKRNPEVANGRENIAKIVKIVFKTKFNQHFLTRFQLPNIAIHFTRRIKELYPDKRHFITTLDVSTQLKVQNIVTDFIKRNRNLGIHNTSVIVAEAKNNNIISYLGSARYGKKSINGYVNGLTAKRSPGSTLKPFLYALALDQGIITPDTILKDTNLRVANFHPDNFEGNYLGPISATESLVRSRNIPAIRLQNAVNKPSFYDFLNNAGLELPFSSDYYGLALTLGAVEVSMEQLSKLYLMLNNTGKLSELNWLAGQKKKNAKRILSRGASFLIMEMLSKNPAPNHEYLKSRYSLKNDKIAWKTGTSIRSKDAWAIGLVNGILIGVWIGDFSGKSNPYYIGRDTAGPLLFQIIEGIRAENPFRTKNKAIPPPELKRILVCPLSGSPKSQHCPTSKLGWVIRGISPIKECHTHRSLKTDLTNPSQESKKINKIYELWDSDVMSIFASSGLARRVFSKTTGFISDSTENPQIITPQVGVKYIALNNSINQIVFSAVKSGATSKLYWYVDNDLVGIGDRITWNALPGKYSVTVTDNRGAQSSRELTVE